jgi:hypothetical protein
MVQDRKKTHQIAIQHIGRQRHKSNGPKQLERDDPAYAKKEVGLMPITTTPRQGRPNYGIVTLRARLIPLLSPRPQFPPPAT